MKDLKRFCLRSSLLIAIFLMIGCSYVKLEKIVETEFPPKEKNFEILVVEGDIERKNESIAFLTVVGNIMTKKHNIEKTMQKAARKLGGDAVVFVTYSFVSGRYPMATGVIVVFKQ